MKKFVGSVILAFGHTWVAISSCGTMIVGFLVWLGIAIWLATSVPGGLIWVFLWLLIGGGLIGSIVGLISLPTRIFRASLVVLGTRLQNSDDAIRLNPQDATAYNTRGLAYEALGKTIEAERDFAKAKELGYDPQAILPSDAELC